MAAVGSIQCECIAKTRRVEYTCVGISVARYTGDTNIICNRQMHVSHDSYTYTAESRIRKPVASDNDEPKNKFVQGKNDSQECGVDCRAWIVVWIKIHMMWDTMKVRQPKNRWKWKPSETIFPEQMWPEYKAERFSGRAFQKVDVHFFQSQVHALKIVKSRGCDNDSNFETIQPH